MSIGQTGDNEYDDYGGNDDDNDLNTFYYAFLISYDFNAFSYVFDFPTTLMHFLSIVWSSYDFNASSFFSGLPTTLMHFL